MSEVIYLTIKGLSEQLSLSTAQVITIVQKFSLEPFRGENDQIQYDLAEFQQAYVEFIEQNRKMQLDYDLDLFRRLLPELKHAVAETITEQLPLQIAIKQSREDKLIEYMTLGRSMLVELRDAIQFNLRILSQVNTATVAGITSTLPTFGVGSGKETFGVSAPISKHLTSSSVGLAEAENIQKRRQTSEGESLRASRFAESRNSSKLSDDENPLFKKMMPQKFQLTNEQSAVIQQYYGFIEKILETDKEDLKQISVEDSGVLEEILEPWASLISDAPRFTTFYSALSRIKDWISAKEQKVTPLILFLALNRNAPGAINARDFLYITGLDDVR